MVTHPVVLVRGGGGGKRLKRGRPGGTVVGRMRIRVGMGVRGRVRVSRVRRRRRRWPLVEVRIILIHHLGTAHHPARARHPRAGLPTCVPERRTTRSYTIFSFHFVHFVLQSCSLSLSFSLFLSVCLHSVCALVPCARTTVPDDPPLAVLDQSKHRRTIDESVRLIGASSRQFVDE